MAQRVTTAQLSERLDSLETNVSKLVDALTGNAMPAAEPTSQPKAEKPSIEVPEGYLKTMTAKAKAHSAKQNATVVLYARRNQRGETKLAYALKERFDSLNDRGLIGAVATFGS